MNEVPAVAAQEIARLRADGVPVTDDDIVWLASLGRRVQSPDGLTIEAAGIRWGVRLSDGTLLKPQTIGASQWLERFGGMFGDRDSAYIVAFAMAHTLPELLALDRSSAVFHAVSEWRQSLDVSHEELSGALSRLLESDTPPRADDDGTPVDVETRIGRLVAATGLPYEYWQEHTWVHAANVNDGSLRWAAMLAPEYGNPDLQQSREALRDMIRAINEIRKRATDGR